MKKYLFSLLLLAGIVSAAYAQLSIPPQTINYKVRYHWGLIDVMIADGTVFVQSDGPNLYGTLNGTSIPWEGRIICVNDTLNARMLDGDRLRETVSYQTGWYRHPHVNAYQSADYNPDDPAFYKNIAGQGDYNASGDTMEAITMTSDLIGMYYYAKAINFPALQPGEVVEIPIEGPYSRLLRITYNGQGRYNEFDTYDCTFEYDYDGGPSGYPIECKIGTDNRIPVFIGASLPLGQVQMLYQY